MSGLIYSAVMVPTATTVESTLVEITAPSDAVVKILSVRIGQNSEEGDAAAEMLNCSISRFSASGTGGNLAIVADPLQVGFPASGCTVDTAHTTLGTGENVIVEDAWNVQAGWYWAPATEAEEIWLSPSGIVGVVCEAAADSITLMCSVMYEEIGGA